MRHRMHRLGVGLLLVGITFLSTSGSAQVIASEKNASATHTLTADEILSRVIVRDRDRQLALERYGSLRTYRMAYHGPIGERHAEMRVQMRFATPDQKQFEVLSESGSTIFCKQILRRLMEGEREGALEKNHERSMLSPANYRSTLIGQEQVDGVTAWVLDVAPRSENKFNYKGRVWISTDDFAVVRIVGSPGSNPSFLMGSAQFDYRYSRSGEFWLPSRNVTTSKLRIGGEITLTVDYGTYEIVTHPDGALGSEASIVTRTHLP